MDAALGPPEKLAERADELTPMLSQYYELCTEYEQSLVLFQVGDFYEAFCEAAETVSRLLEVTLTQREDSTGEYAMAGIPIDNAESYVETLLDAGYRVAIADQVQDPDEASGVVDRAVTRVLTPGTLTEDELLAGDANNFVAAIARGDTIEADAGTFALSLLDVSTGEFVATSDEEWETVRDELGRFAPAEVITDCEDVIEELPADCTISAFDRTAFQQDRAAEQLRAYFGDPETLLASQAELRACGALLAYAEYARGGEVDRLDYLNHLTRYDPREYMLLDAVALRSLELFERRTVHGEDDATLAGVIDETVTAMGSRRLTEWLRRPLVDAEPIRARHEAVGELLESVQVREQLREQLRSVYDLERLISRIARNRANARDLRSLAATLAAVPSIRAELAGVETPLLRELREDLDPLVDARELIEDAIVEDPPIELTEGGVIKDSYHDRLASLRSTEREGKAWIDELEADERERTGIDSLKVGYNSVHGYYIEVTKPNLDLVPEEYQRRQTLKNSERFVTPELKEREEEIVSAEGQADDLEYELFCEVRSSVAEESERVQSLADALASLDALAAFAEVAATQDYCQPEIVDEQVIEIEGGRHPIVERRQSSFVPNDSKLAPDERMAVITGPNMSGKSTYMRQIALIVILAQAGSFVPAASATIGPVDRVFTRVGASDDIAGGRSTFMVEMLELAEILGDASGASLVLLDEVGRGTSTADGLAIARAITEYIHDELGALTLFATHHHELTATAEALDGGCNLHFEADQRDGEIEFDHSVRRGAATASYGVEVAQEAGVPECVVERAHTLLEDSGGSETASERAGAGRADVGEADQEATVEPALPSGGTPLDDSTAAALAALRETDVATLTPIEALNRLAEIKRNLE
jgi:DNA mismatch repair protein MutS